MENLGNKGASAAMDGPDDWVPAGIPEGFEIEGATPQDPRGLIPFIRDTATKYGIDPDVAVRVAGSEGLRNPVGDGGMSHGAFQLFTGGGLGNDFQKATRLDPSDPANERATIEYALAHASKNGWGAFHGAKRIGLDNFAGIGGGQALALQAPDKSAPTVQHFTQSPDRRAAPAIVWDDEQRKAPAIVWDGPDDWVPAGIPEGFELEKPSSVPNGFGYGGGDTTTTPPLADVPAQFRDDVKGIAKGAVRGFENLTSIGPRIAYWLGHKVQSGLETIGGDGVKSIAGIPTPGLDFKAMREKQDEQDKLGAAIRTAMAPAPSTYLPDPETGQGKFVQGVAEFAPAALTPGSAMRKAANVILPGAASEAAGEATAGTPYEPYARTGAALLAGYGTAKVGSGAPKVTGPTSEEYFDASNQGFAKARAMDVAVKSEPMSALATQTLTELKGRGMTPRTAPQTVGALKDIQQTANPTNGALSLSGADLEAYRQELGQIARGGGTDGAAAGHAIEKLNDFLTNIKPADVHKGDAQAMAAVFDEARQNWAAGKRLQALEGALERGEQNAKSSYAGQNINNAIRQALKPLVRPNIRGEIPARKMGFNDAEIAAIKRTVEGTTGGNVARYVGALAPNHTLPIMAHVYTALQTGGASIPLSLAAKGLKLIGDRSTAMNAEAARQLAASRGPLARTQAMMTSGPSGPAVRLPPSVQAMLAGLLSVPR